MARRKEPAIPDRLLDELLDGRDAASAFNDPGRFDALKKAVAERALKAEMDAFAAGPWGAKYPAIAMSWRRHWQEVIPFFAFPDEVRRIMYTTNSIEALNSKLRRAVRTRGHFPSDEAALKLLYLVLNRAEKDWRIPPREWSMAKPQFVILFEDRFVTM